MLIHQWYDLNEFIREAFDPLFFALHVMVDLGDLIGEKLSLDVDPSMV